jgi:hypothetical protein
LIYQLAELLVAEAEEHFPVRRGIIPNGEDRASNTLGRSIASHDYSKAANAVSQVRGSLIDRCDVKLGHVLGLKHYQQAVVRGPKVRPKRFIRVVRENNVSPFRSVYSPYFRLTVDQLRVEQIIENLKHDALVVSGVFTARGDAPEFLLERLTLKTGIQANVVQRWPRFSRLRLTPTDVPFDQSDVTACDSDNRRLGIRTPAARRSRVV